MQQLFGVVNKFLALDRSSSRRELSLRTYKVAPSGRVWCCVVMPGGLRQLLLEACATLCVRDCFARSTIVVAVVVILIPTAQVVPLSHNAGVVEMVTDTRSLSDILVSSKGVHPRYNRRDWPTMQCRKCMEDVKDGGEERKRAALRKVYDNFQPAMHYVFLEEYPHPATWCVSTDMTLHSLAWCSMCGCRCHQSVAHTCPFRWSQVCSPTSIHPQRCNVQLCRIRRWAGRPSSSEHSV
jgi:hypothetical protein